MEITIRCKLVAKENDLDGYITYVFENLENFSFGKKYCMLTRWPNWLTKDVDLGDIGYVSYKEVIAGQDTWWDGNNFIPYNYSNLIFIKFIKETDTLNKDIIL